jgi:hypothetical protein
LQRQSQTLLPIPLVTLLFVTFAMGASDIVPVMIAALAERDGMMIDCRFHRMIVCPLLDALLPAHMASPAISLKHLPASDCFVVVPAILPTPSPVGACLPLSLPLDLGNALLA